MLRARRLGLADAGGPGGGLGMLSLPLLEVQAAASIAAAERAPYGRGEETASTCTARSKSKACT